VPIGKLFEKMRLVARFGGKVALPNVRYWVNSGRHLLNSSSSGFDPHVWSGRALQEDFAELAVSGLASMYPASDWSMWCSGPSWISARVRSR
jgi:hypothetical protein